jgi:hypothetical protein
MKTLHAWYKDAAGNVSITASASILLDRTIPSNGTMTATPGNAQVVLTWSGFADAGSGLATGSYKLYYSATGNPADTGYSAACNGSPLYTGSATSFSHTGLTNGTTYYYRVCVSDKAGNTATGATATATPAGGVDSTAPVGTVVINGGAPYSASTTVTLTLNATDAMAVTAYWLSLGTSHPRRALRVGRPSLPRQTTVPPYPIPSPSRPMDRRPCTSGTRMRRATCPRWPRRR